MDLAVVWGETSLVRARVLTWKCEDYPGHNGGKREKALENGSLRGRMRGPKGVIRHGNAGADASGGGKGGYYVYG